MLLDASAVPERPAGAGVYVVNLVAGLASRSEIDLHLVTRRNDASRWNELVPSATVHAVVPTPRPSRLLWEQRQGPSLARDLAVDLWHGPHYTMPIRLDIPAVVTVHDLTFFDHPEWHERTKVVFFRRAIRAAARRAAALVAVSEHTATRLRELDPAGTIVAAPHGVDHERFHQDGRGTPNDLEILRRAGAQPPFVAFAGTIEPRKDVARLVAAFARIAPDHPDLQLVLVGQDGWGAAAVRDAVAATGVATRILRPGFVSDETIPALFRQAEVVAYPSLDEGFGLPVLEAMACGAAVVTTSDTAMAEVAGDATRLVPPGDVDALAHELAELLDDPEASRDLGARAAERAGAFTWEASVDRHVEAYRLAATG